MNTSTPDPINRIEWRNASTLNANDYNPNVVLTPEMRLLERSILKTGWVQPVLITKAGVIIDGFHRVTLSRISEPLRKTYKGMVPCAVMDIDRPTAMILTIRMNRAKGSHMALRMSEIVTELVAKHNLDPQQVAAEIGAEANEIELLLQQDVFKAKKIADWKYSKAWVPEESGKGRK
jgi:ParB-like chromosome segregation protein Spo0J